jgi:hypothetical protein
MKPIIWLGGILVVLGILGFAVPVFTTSRTTNVAQLGDLKIQATERSSHAVPPIVSTGAIILGVLFLGAGLYQRR